MLFNSIDFIIFAAIFFIFFPLLQKIKSLRFLYIITASFVFYGWWDWRYLFLIIISGLIDFIAGYCIYNYENKKRFFLILSIFSNIGILFTFKYFTWFASNVELFLHQVFSYETDLLSSIPPFFKVLPIGISFYTFQSLSYTIDIYRGKSKPTKNPLLFFSYLSMFPQLVAGPIVRAEDMLYQLDKPNRVDSKMVSDGLNRIARGFFKKVVMADSLAPFVATAFASNVAEHGCLFWWIAVTAFAVQIYCDFSGYSDIAIGIAKWMGFNIKRNFDHPYISSSLKEFWTRWHISLSTWFRDYVYIPIGGSRKSSFRSQFNMWITMLIAGFWHGAAWNYVFWGAVHAFFLSLERYLRKYIEIRKNYLGLICSTVFTMLLVWIAWVFFRCASISQAFSIILTMFDLRNFSLTDLHTVPQIGIFLIIIVLVLREIYVFLESKIGFHARIFDISIIKSLITALLLAICLFYRGSGNAFIYFQF